MSLFFFGRIVARADIEPQISWTAGYQEIFSAAYLFTFGFQGVLRVVDDLQQTPKRYRAWMSSPNPQPALSKEIVKSYICSRSSAGSNGGFGIGIAPRRM